MLAYQERALSLLPKPGLEVLTYRLVKKHSTVIQKRYNSYILEKHINHTLKKLRDFLLLSLNNTNKCTNKEITR